MTAKYEVALEAWKTTVEVQRHFNDIALKIRNLAVTVLAALLSAAALSLKEHVTVVGPTPGTPLAFYLLSAALVAWIAFYVMDRFWYHRLLIGAVRHGEAIEAKWSDEFPEMCLTRTISEKSAIRLWKWITPWRKTAAEFRSTARVDAFYVLGAALLVTSLAIVRSAHDPAVLQKAFATPSETSCHCTDGEESDHDQQNKR